MITRYQARPNRDEWPSGATAGVNCSLCEAGTFWTGSGQDALLTQQAYKRCITALQSRSSCDNTDLRGLTSASGQPSTHYMFYRPRTVSIDLVCRLNCGSQLHPVRGRDLWDRVRSGCIDCFSMRDNYFVDTYYDNSLPGET